MTDAVEQLIKEILKSLPRLSATEAELMNRIQVYRWEDENDPANVNKVYIGTVAVSSTGEFHLNTINQDEAQSAARLQRVLDAIQAKGKLKTDFEELEEVDGEVMLVLKEIKVAPGDPIYSYAVRSLLTQFGYICT